MKTITTLLLLNTLLYSAESIQEAFEGLSHDGEIRLGAVKTDDASNNAKNTVALGGNLGFETAPFYGLSVGARFYTTNALFSKKEEPMFLSSDAKSYSILGEAYVKAEFSDTALTIGRQVLETPYANSDDVGMIQNSFEAYSLLNRSIPDTLVYLAILNKWSGVDSEVHDEFKELQSSEKAVLMAGVIYEGIKNTTLQAWHYKFDTLAYNYAEMGYEDERYALAVQYTDQENSNRAFGLMASGNLGAFTFSTAYNKVDGRVNNGFGGGPFFTSAEDHTIEIDELNQEGVLGSLSYSNDALTLGVTHAHFLVGADDTDYLVAYDFSEKQNIEFIYSDLHEDGTLVRLFAKYNF